MEEIVLDAIVCPGLIADPLWVSDPLLGIVVMMILASELFSLSVY